jgi:hypothetical protein
LSARATSKIRRATPRIVDGRFFMSRENHGKQGVFDRYARCALNGASGRGGDDGVQVFSNVPW